MFVDVFWKHCKKNENHRAIWVEEYRFVKHTICLILLIMLVSSTCKPHMKWMEIFKRILKMDKFEGYYWLSPIWPDVSPWCPSFFKFYLLFLQPWICWMCEHWIRDHLYRWYCWTNTAHKECCLVESSLLTFFGKLSNFSPGLVYMKS